MTSQMVILTTNNDLNPANGLFLDSCRLSHYYFLRPDLASIEDIITTYQKDNHVTL